MRLLCNKKILKKVDIKTKQKIQYLLFDIKKSNTIELLNCFTTNTLIKIFFTI